MATTLPKRTPTPADRAAPSLVPGGGRQRRWSLALVAILVTLGSALAFVVLWMNAGDRKPVLVQFFATWCGYCRRMDATTFTNASVIADLKKAVTVRVDGEEEEVRDGYRGAELADKYGVRVFPTHVLVDGEGRVVARAPGFMEPQQFLSWFKTSLAKAYQQSALQPSGS